MTKNEIQKALREQCNDTRNSLGLTIDKANTNDDSEDEDKPIHLVAKPPKTKDSKKRKRSLTSPSKPEQPFTQQPSVQQPISQQHQQPYSLAPAMSAMPFVSNTRQTNEYVPQYMAFNPYSVYTQYPQQLQ